ncbi:hypothetical protein ACOMICROBIO_GDFFDHBD_02650 [Vibrio sp. B1REV9]|uniref:6-hydroxymethylpterin diphosphokinase MptE-like protein n=1 Tax=Vibrio sp. B1REV9 TaxID=2751179 RepID=UPI001AF6A232|nr:6-hydroxymethylpterin diphosphokinase MptE-like protein [Vibrio sp. B1REV9]CAE6931807.1 hypothetical protein ACOMICROBIO_GDFFDHBD_02650 [Vibrio sp. B1REV9]
MMTPIYQQHLDIISKRWPIVASALEQASFDELEFEVVEKTNITLKVNGVQLSSAYAPLEEAFQYRSLTSGNNYHVWGIGMGNVQSLLIQDKECQSIHVYLYNLELAKLVLSLVPHPWLSDTRVTLHYVNEHSDNITQQLRGLTDCGCIILTGDKFISKRTHQWLFFRMENTLTMQHVHRNQLDNDDAFLQREAENLSQLKRMPSIDTFIQYKINDAICIGAGPSLTHHIEELKTIYHQKSRPRFIAAATACKCLLENGIKPDVVYAIDINIPESYIPFHIAQNTILIAGSRLPLGHLTQWHGEKYYLHTADHTYDRINNVLPTAFRPYVYGSVIHPLIHTTLIQGAKNIRLIGCDFGFPGEIIHASMDNDANDHNSTMTAVTENGYGQMIKTSPTYRMFATGVENLISAAPDTRFYNMSRMGAKVIGASYLDELDGDQHAN